MRAPSLSRAPRMRLSCLGPEVLMYEASSVAATSPTVSMEVMQKMMMSGRMAGAAVRRGKGVQGKAGAWVAGWREAWRGHERRQPCLPPGLTVDAKGK